MLGQTALFRVRLNKSKFLLQRILGSNLSILSLSSIEKSDMYSNSHFPAIVQGEALVVYWNVPFLFVFG